MVRPSTKVELLSNRGFSLIELMVSLSVFAIVMTISTGTILIMIDINAKAQALFTSTTNVSFALDSITREIRTGHHYYCGTGNPPGSPTSGTGAYTVTATSECNEANIESDIYILFTREEDGVRSGYRVRKVPIDDVNTDVLIGVLEQYNGLTWSKITSERDVDIQVFAVKANSVDTIENGGDVIQPAVSLKVGGTLYNGLDEPTSFEINSRVIQRRLDVI